jgi:archaellum component FlaF (FlaF/FlaG flagellin family)
MKNLKLLILTAFIAITGNLFSQTNSGPDIIITNVNVIDEGCVVENNFIWSFQEVEVTVSNVGTEGFTSYSVTSELAVTGGQLVSGSVNQDYLFPGQSITLSGTLYSINTSWTEGQSNIFTVSVTEPFYETGDALLNNAYEVFQTETVDCSDLSIIDVQALLAPNSIPCNPQTLEYGIGIGFASTGNQDTIFSVCQDIDILNVTTGEEYLNTTICWGIDTSLPTQGPYTSGWLWVNTLWAIPVDGNTYQYTVTIYDIVATGVDGNLEDNTIVLTVDTSPYDYDNCIYGCTDPTATNYDSTADVDDGSCNYTILELSYLSSECSVDCDPTGAFYYVTSTFQNTGNVAITDFCAEWNINGGEQDVECFTGDLQPNATTTITHGPIYTDGSGIGYIYIQSLNGVTLNPELDFLVSLSCIGDAEATCVYGCTDNTACNYDATADFDDESCTYVDGVCETCENGVIVDNDVDDDGVCDADEVSGCTNASACNYNTLATDDDGSCVLPVDCETCSGETDGTGTVVDNDADDDGICDTNEIVGCQDETACNYNPGATDAGNCTYVVDACEVCVNGQVVLNDVDGDGICDDDEVEGCTDPTACSYDATATENDPLLCTYATGCDTCIDGNVIDGDINNDNICDGPDASVTIVINEIACLPAPGHVIFNIIFENLGPDPLTDFCFTLTGDNSTTSGFCFSNSFPIGGGLPLETGETTIIAIQETFDIGPTYNFTVVLSSINVNSGGEHPSYLANNTYNYQIDSSTLADPCTYGCTDVTACNYNDAADVDDTSCVLPVDCETCSGETDGTGTIVDNDADDDGVCDGNEVLGSTDANACNYNMAATDDDGACTYATGCDYCSGATDGTGTVVDGDTDNDGVCDVDEIPGCQEATACNYNADATDDDNSCVYADGACEICDGFGGVIDNDADGDGICDEDEVSGCTDATACNYNADATDDDGSCEPNIQCINGNTFDCNEVLIPNCTDTDGDGICDTCEIPGQILTVMAYVTLVKYQDVFQTGRVTITQTQQMTTARVNMKAAQVAPTLMHVTMTPLRL